MPGTDVLRGAYCPLVVPFRDGRIDFETYGKLMTPQVKSDKLPMPEHLRAYVVDGKLRLSLRDAIALTLENNTAVRVQETQVELPARTAAAQSHRLWAPPAVDDVVVVPLELVDPAGVTGVPGVLGSSSGRGGRRWTSTLHPNSVTTVGAEATPRTTRIRPASRMGEL